MKAGAYLRGGVTLLLLGWLFSRFNATQALAGLSKAQLGFAVVAFVITLFMILVMAFRWHLLLGALGLALPFREVASVTFLGHYFGYFLPSVGSDVVRIGYLSRGRGKSVELTISTVVDRYLGLLALLGLGLIALLLHRPAGQLRTTVSLVYMVTAALLAFLLGAALTTRMTGQWIDAVGKGSTGWLKLIYRRIQDAMDLYAKRKLVLLRALAFSVASQILSIAVCYCLALGFGTDLQPLDFLYAIPVVNLAIVLPISIGGVGVGEWTLVYLLKDLGMAPDAAFSVSLLNLAVRLGAAALGAGFYLIRGKL